MESYDTVKEYIIKLKDNSKTIYSLLERISDEQMGSAEELTEIRGKLKNLYASMSVITEASDSFSSTIRKSEELISFGLSLSGEIMEKIQNFLQTTSTLSSNLRSLMGKREEINSIVDSLLDLNQASANTARNAEIKAYQAGSSGKGFEVVAGELGELTGDSLEMVDEMVELLESLRDESKEVVEKFTALEETLSKFQEITDNLEYSSNELKDNLSQILDTSQHLIGLLEEINTRRRNVDAAANKLLNLSNDFIIKAGIVNLIMVQKESMGDILEHHADIYNRIVEKGLRQINQNIEHIEFALKVIKRLNHNSRSDVSKLGRVDFDREIDPGELEGIEDMFQDIRKEMLNVEDVIKTTLEKATQGKDGVKRVRDFISNEREGMQDIFVIQERLSEISSNLGRLMDRIENLSEQIRVLSLYGKIEASRIPDDFRGLNAIVDEMQSLSDNYAEIANDLRGFYEPLREEIESLDRMIQKLTGIIKRLWDIVEESVNTFEENESQIENLTRIASGIRPSLDEQKKIVSNITSSFSSISETMKSNIKSLNRLEENMDMEENTIKNFLDDNSWKNVSAINTEENNEEKELRFYLNSNPLTVDPSQCGDATSNRVASYIHRGLFDFGLSGQVYPLVVKNWELSEDALEWFFTLRDDVVDHKGRKIDAEDVMFSLNRVREGPNKFIIDPVDEIKLKGRYSIMIRLRTPFMPFTANLATIGGSIVSRESRSNETNIRAGIGPFRIIDFDEEGDIVLESFENYISGSPYVKRIIYRKGESGLQLFKEGSVDIAPIGANDVTEVKSDPNLKECLISSNYLNVNYMGFNFKREDLPFSKKAVRQAMNYAVDNRALIEETISGFGSVSRGIFPPGLSVHDKNLKGYEYNPAKARDLLKEAGYKDGLPGKYKLSISDSEANVKRANFLKSAFLKIGINIEIDRHPWGDFLQKAHDGETELFLLGWNADNGDPNNFLFPLFHSSTKGIGGNTTFYANDEIDSLIEEGVREINPIKRERIYRKVERRLVEDAPMVFLIHSINFMLVKPSVIGYKPDPLDYPHFEWIGVE